MTAEELDCARAECAAAGVALAARREADYGDVIRIANEAARLARIGWVPGDPDPYVWIDPFEGRPSYG